jgi:hypothetical protein
MTPRRIAQLTACVALLSHASPALACYLPGPIVTLRQDAAQCRFLVVGTLTNACDGPDGTTDLVITTVLRSDPAIKGRKVITIPRYVAIADPKNPPQMLVFGDVFKGQLDLYRGIMVGPGVVEYVKGLLAINIKDPARLLRYCFDYLEHPNADVAGDALNEFRLADETELRTVGRTLSANKLCCWLQNERLQPARASLYAFLLGLCGNRDDAALLRRLLERAVKQDSWPSLDGLLTGYTLLDPKSGWAFTRSLLKDPAHEFTVRYSALKSVRYLYTSKIGVVRNDDLLDGMRLLLDQSDMADLPIDDLRKWKCWKYTDQILGLAGRRGFDIPLVRRTLVRYALQCPDARARRFVDEQRKINPELVELAEETLKTQVRSSEASP